VNLVKKTDFILIKNTGKFFLCDCSGFNGATIDLWSLLRKPHGSIEVLPEHVAQIWIEMEASGGPTPLFEEYKARLKKAEQKKEDIVYVFKGSVREKNQLDQSPADVNFFFSPMQRGEIKEKISDFFRGLGFSEGIGNSEEEYLNGYILQFTNDLYAIIGRIEKMA